MSPYFGNPDLGGKHMRQDYRSGLKLHNLKKTLGFKNAQGSMHPVAGQVEGGLPFVPESFDYVLALYSVPLYIDDEPKTYMNLFSTIKDALKKDGVAVLFPIPESKKEFISEVLTSLNVSNYEFTSIPESGDNVYRNEKTYRVKIIK